MEYCRSQQLLSGSYDMSRRDDGVFLGGGFFKGLERECIDSAEISPGEFVDGFRSAVVEREISSPRHGATMVEILEGFVTREQPEDGAVSHAFSDTLQVVSGEHLRQPLLTGKDEGQDEF